MISVHESAIHSFYFAYYGRPADPEGLAFWSMQLERAGGDFQAIADAFAVSEEATVRFGTETTAQRVSSVYQQLFNRAPDDAGLAYWTEAVESGRTTLADVTLNILQGAQGSDATISSLRQQAAQDFTATVVESQVQYSGYAAIEASRVLLSAISPETTQGDIAAMVQKVQTLVNIAHDTPEVIAAIGTGGNLATLFATARGRAEPEQLFHSLVDLAKTAAGNPVTLDALLRGGGMNKVLEVMPAAATLEDVVVALGKGGLDAAIEVVYPTAPSEPAPMPQYFITFESGVLTISGPGTKEALVDLAKHTIEFGGTVRTLTSKEPIVSVIDKGYGGTVTLSGTIDEITAVLPKSQDVGYRIVDSKTAIFGGTALERSLNADVQDLLSSAKLVKIAEPLSMVEFDLLGSLAGFDLVKLQVTVDRTPPNAGALQFVAQGLDPSARDLATNIDTFSIKVDGAEEGTIVQYQVMNEKTGRWDDLATSVFDSLAQGDYAYRAVVIDVAGNVAFTETITIAIDKTAPVVASIAYGNNNGIISSADTIEVRVSFSETVTVQDGTTINFANGGSAVYDSGSGTDNLVFKYTPQAGESTEGLALAATGALTGVIADHVGNSLSGKAFDALPIAKAPAVDVDAPLQSIVITTITQNDGTATSASVEGSTDPLATNMPVAAVRATLSAVLGQDEQVQYSLDGGKHWLTDGVKVKELKVGIEGLSTVGNPTLMVRVIDAAGNTGKEASHAIVLDTLAPQAGSISFAGVSEHAFDTALDNVTNVDVVTVDFQHTGSWIGAGERLQYTVDGVTWSEAGLTADAATGKISIAGVDLREGTLDHSGNRVTTVAVRAIDAAGNTSPVGSTELVLDKQPAAIVSIGFAANEGIISAADTVELVVSFNEAVTVQGSATVHFTNGGSAVYDSGSGSDKLVFKYTPQAGQSTDFLKLDVKAPFTGAIVDHAGNALPAKAFGALPVAHAPAVDVDAPLQSIVIKTISQAHGDSVSVEGITDPLATNLAVATVRATLSSELEQGEQVQYSLDGGKHWSSQGVAVTKHKVSIDGVHTEGNPTLQVRVIDAAGNVGKEASHAIVLDTLAPQAGSVSFAGVTEGMLDSVADNVTNVDVVTVEFNHSGAWIGAGERLQYSVDGINWSEEGLTADASSGKISIANVDLREGALAIDGNRVTTVAVRAIDAAGNTSQVGSKELVLDTSAAAITSIGFARNDGVLSATDTIELAVSFDAPVTVDAGATIRFANGGSAVYDSGSGTDKLVFKYVPQAGENTTGLKLAALAPFTGAIVDLAGNKLPFGAFHALSLANAPAVDVDAPTQSIVFTSISQGNDGSDSPESSTSPLATNLPVATVYAKLSSALAQGEQVEFSLDGTYWSTQNVTVDGLKITVDGLLAHVNPIVKLRVADAAGNSGTPVSQAIVFDGAPPDAGSLDFAGVTDSLFDSVDDHVTNVNVVTVDFAHTGSWHAAGERLQYTTDGIHWKEDGLTFNTVTNTVSIAGVDLREGQPAADLSGNRVTTVAVRAIDAAGNTSALGSQELVLDTHVGTPLLMLDTTAGKGAYLTVGIDADGRAEYSLNGQDGWTTTAPVATEDETTVYVRQVDAAGNISATTNLKIELDTTPPPKLGIALMNDTGLSATDKVTSYGGFLVSGVEKVAGSDWEYSVNGGLFQRGYVSDQNGLATRILTGDGDYVVTVRQFDKAGNVSLENTLEFTLDTQAPVLAFDSVTGWAGQKHIVNRDHADVVFGYQGKVVAGDKIEYRINGGDWISDSKIKLDSLLNTITLENMDLSTSDPLIDLKVTDLAGNVSNVANVMVDGSYTVPVAVPTMVLKPTVDGLLVTATVDGQLIQQGHIIFPSMTFVGANGSTSVVANTPFLIGQQPMGNLHPIAGTSPLTLKGAFGQIMDTSGTVYKFGNLNMDSAQFTTAAVNVFVWGFGGADVIRTGMGNDGLYGGEGDDQLYGNAGNDVLVGGTGINLLDGGAGADRIDITQGQNTLLYRRGDSTVESMDVVTFADQGANDFVPQTFKFVDSSSIMDMVSWTGIANPTSNSVDDLVIALNVTYQRTFEGMSNAAMVVQFNNTDTYVVVDTGNGYVDKSDTVIKLIGNVPDVSDFNFGLDIVFGMPSP